MTAKWNHTSDWRLTFSGAITIGRLEPPNEDDDIVPPPLPMFTLKDSEINRFGVFNLKDPEEKLDWGVRGGQVTCKYNETKTSVMFGFNFKTEWVYLKLNK